MTTTLTAPSVGIIPKICTTGTAVCIATGPSLTQEDVDYCCGKATVVAINDAYKLAPWADVLYACDHDWWFHHNGAKGFGGLRFSITPTAGKLGATVLTQGVQFGLSSDPNEIRHGKNGGYQALQVAVRAGAQRVLLLGYDMQPGPNGKAHYFGQHPAPLKKKMPFDEWRHAFSTIVEPLKSLGVEVVNCSRETALTCFPLKSLREAL